MPATGRLLSAIPNRPHAAVMLRSAALAFLFALAPLAAQACDVQAEFGEVRRLYAEKAATLPKETYVTIGAALQTAGQLHEVGKDAEACTRVAELRALLSAAPALTAQTRPGEPE